jgi:APA family basic amino acid/polyamine antiporter
VHEKREHRFEFIVICGMIMALIAGFIPLGDLAELVNIGTLAAFVLVCLGVVVLRITQPELPRPFARLLTPFCQLLGVFSCSALMCFLPKETWMRFFVCVSAGADCLFCLCQTTQ